ncbi:MULTISPECIES: T3SS effector HopA1 family protein [Chroococcidiopsis]|jgi:hypothetical protein|uniref:Uncharacterized protein n=1 Tax=Chroococcidiopsis thermalis (strain PCC 7203) TaxID=251229 RepID=K9U0U6_CHRTP|nr:MULTISPECIES: T3SS effector HopA1 family protein [Chroococcidiopsis]AFY88717.1 hypothetical protein Chro_3253 [Chroococcidiopsis thermalis PCC 7203]MBE9020039.1 hypothetical protein [Chroococcidiopsidales cyanobacterium LEGE 13417]PSB44825.1 hypothetical protein C7B80_19135 [Cyanosarcina cf. burmensis CCALA 770]URD48033.1 T3SS effector HopA1 family protein [Chroococcidiopsis sp. CCNUC1]
MQLLDSAQNQLSDFETDKLLAALHDIVRKIQIESTFCIRHLDYQAWQLPADRLPRFQQLPLELQTKYLSQQLCGFLYSIYYNGSLKSALALDADSVGLELHQNLENNTFLGVDLEFYQRLHSSNSGKGYFDPGWQVLREESDGSLAVKKTDLTLHIERDRHLQPVEQSATVGDSVAILMPRNLVQNGFYMAVGDAGPTRLGNIVRIYFNLSSEGAVVVMGNLTRQLNDINIPFSFKVLYNPPDYKRYDSGVLYFDKSNYEDVQPLLQAVYVEHQSHFQSEVPLFTKLLAPGLALAEEPNRKFSAQESFGLNRCKIVANGLLEAWQQQDSSTEGRMASISKHFSLQEIDLQRPYLNPKSEDIYTPLDWRYIVIK